MAGPDRPDVLILMADQLNPTCLGCAGDPVVRTPHIDALAAEGVCFDAAYTVCPVCMPARGSFVSGLYPHNHQFWTNFTDQRFPADLCPHFRDMQQAGYATAKVGKFHYFNPAWGGDFEDHQDYYHALGFDFAEETTGVYMTPFHKSEYTRYLQRKGLLDPYIRDVAKRMEEGQYAWWPSPLSPDDHNDAYIGRRAVEVIERADPGQPLCLFVSFPGPHCPLDAPGEYATMYDPMDVPLPDNVPEVTRMGPREFSRDEVRHMRAAYYGKISLIDHWVGRIADAMERRGAWDRALAFFTADHGDHMGAHGRMSKGSFYDESARVPLIVRWPGRVQAGARTNALAELIDVCPTFLDAIGVDRTSGHFGASLLPVACGDADRVHDAVFSEIRQAGGLAYMVRTERYKWWINPKREALFDMAADPLEQRDLVQSEPHQAVRAAMRDRLSRFLVETQVDRARDYKSLFTRAGIEAGTEGLAEHMYRLFKRCQGLSGAE